MKKTTIAVLLVAIAAWAYPIHAASARPSEEQAIFINYERLHQNQNRANETLHTSVSKTNLPGQNQAKQRNPKSNLPPTSGPYNGRNYSKEEVQELIKEYSQQYGINPAVPLCIALKESGYNQFSKNRNSSASGVFQYLAGTWRGTDEGKTGLSEFDAEANIKAAIKYMAARKNTTPWVVGKNCPRL